MVIGMHMRFGTSRAEFTQERVYFYQIGSQYVYWPWRADGGQVIVRKAKYMAQRDSNLERRLAARRTETLWCCLMSRYLMQEWSGVN